MSSRRALVVGVSNYDAGEWSQLRAPQVDAQLVTNCLADPAIGDYEVVTLVDPTSDDLKNALVDHYADAVRDDVLLFYYSGHGFIDQHNDFHLTTTNTKLDRLDTTAVEGSFILRRSNRTRSQRQIIMLDCCFGAALVGGAKGPNALGSPVQLDTHFVPALSGHGTYIMTSTGRTEFAYERTVTTSLKSNEARSAFTQAVLEGLQTGEADRDLDGLITVDELFEFVADRMQHSKDPTRPQTPTKHVTSQQMGAVVVARSTLPPLGKAEALLRRQDPESRHAGLRILTELLKDETQAEAATTALQSIADYDPNPTVRTAATQTLGTAPDTQPEPDAEAAKIERHANSQIDGSPTPSATRPRLSSRSAVQLKNGYIASAGSDNTVQIWNPNQPGTTIATYRGHNRTVRAVTELADGNIASAGSDNTVQIWNPNQPGTTIATYRGHNRTVRAVTELADGNIASAGSDNTVQIWNPNQPETTIATYRAGISGVWALAELADGNIASAGSDGTVQIWNPNQPETTIATYSGHSSNVLSVVVLTNGNIASAGWDGTVRIWAPDDPETTITIYRGHTGGVRSVAELANGNIASAGTDGTVQIWNPSKPVRPIATYRGHTGPVSLAIELANGNIASTSVTDTIQIWNPDNHLDGPMWVGGDRDTGDRLNPSAPSGKPSGSSPIQRRSRWFGGVSTAVVLVGFALSQLALSTGIANRYYGSGNLWERIPAQDISPALTVFTLASGFAVVSLYFVARYRQSAVLLAAASASATVKLALLWSFRSSFDPDQFNCEIGSGCSTSPQYTAALALAPGEIVVLLILMVPLSRRSRTTSDLALNTN